MHHKQTRRIEPPVRVAFLIDRLGTGGVETQLLRIIRQVDRAKIEPYLCLFDGGDAALKALEPDDVPVLRLGIRGRRAMIVNTWRFARFLRHNQIDVLHVDQPASTQFGIPAGWLARVPYLIRTRRNMGYWMSRGDRWTGRLFTRMVDLTITNCRACLESIVEIERARPETIAILPNDIDLAAFRHIPLPSPEPPAEDAGPVVGMIGNLRPVKAPDDLVEAAARVAGRCPGAVFRIAGEGPLRPELERRIARLNLAGRFELPGCTHDVPGFLRTTDIAVLCSHSEGLANVLLEYMAAGRPIVATRVGGAAEVIDHEVHGLLVPPSDPQALAGAIERLITDRPLAARLAAAARDRVTHEYGGPNIGQRFQSLLLDRLGCGNTAMPALDVPKRGQASYVAPASLATTHAGEAITSRADS